MEQHFIAITEKAPKLTMLEEGLAREFLADYDSYENRVEDINNVVPMRRCLEKADIFELLDATEGIVLWQMVRAPGLGLLWVALRLPWRRKRDLIGKKRLIKKKMIC